MSAPSTVQHVAIVGTGVIGAGWAARHLAHGLEVIATDPAAGAEARLREATRAAIPALASQGFDMAGWAERLHFTADVEAAVAQADFIQESAPEREDLKRTVLARIDAAAPVSAIIASSSSGLLPSRLQAGLVHPERMLIAHPFNPVYLLPLVELVAGTQTSRDSVTRAADFYRAVGMRPLVVRKEIEGFIADRLMEALWREALHLVNDGVATTEEADAAVVYGCGLRWALMGTFLTFHLAGGDAGMRHMLEQFGPALKLPWTHTVAPELTDQLIDRVVEGCEQQAAGRSVADLVKRRDEFLVRLIELAGEYWPEAEGRAGAI